VHVVALACATLFGCGDVDGRPEDDAGTVEPMMCSDRQPFCDRDGMTVRACVDGVPGHMLEQCARNTMCTAGRCMSQECAVIWRDHHTIAGCFFYTAQAPNVASDAEQPMSFLITNAGGAETTVSLEQIDGSARWAPSTSTTVPPGESARLSIAREEVTTIGVSRGTGLRLVSNLPVTVAQIESDDADEKALSSSGTMLLPANALGKHHRVLAYPQRTTPDIDALAGSAGGAARLLIVGTRPGTPVHLTAGPNGAAIVGLDPITMASDTPMTVFLDDGDVLQVSSAADTDDLSGFEIWADLPVAVFSGNVATAYGVAGAGGINSPDMAHEQIPPIWSWSFKYVAAWLPPQANTCDTLLGPPDASLWRMVAGGPGTTTVQLFVPPGVELQGLQSDTITLTEGGVAEFMSSGGSFSVRASGPLLLAQGIDCEPTLALAVPADEWLSDLSFAVLPNFDQLIAVARVKGATVILDGVPLDAGRFLPAGTDDKGTAYEVARIPLATCNPRELICTHRLTGQFGMTLRGMDVLSSYALTARSWTSCNDDADLSCVD
jgi:hypothetical protein